MSSQVSLLAGLLHEAGFCWASADEIDRALERLNVHGCEPDNVASVLYKWRKRAVRSALGQCRSRARDVLKGDGTDHNMEDVAVRAIEQMDVEGQIGLFDTIDERTSHLATAPMRQGR